jgi:hypothetical protein
MRWKPCAFLPATTQTLTNPIYILTSAIIYYHYIYVYNNMSAAYILRCDIISCAFIFPYNLDHINGTRLTVFR